MNAERLRSLLSQIYDGETALALAERIEARISAHRRQSTRTPADAQWQASDVMLITYADAIHGHGDLSPLATLKSFLQEWAQDVVSHVHLLPFFPFTSDDGFAVSDYRSVDENHGNWTDIETLGQDYALVFDLVVNHASSAHPDFQQFLADQSPGNRYFKTAAPDADLSQVTRPRATPALQEFQTAAGPRWVWCTFSRDQVDWDFENPDVLFDFVDLLVTYYEKGASWLRVDAIAFLWKELGTTCVHLPQTHAVVKLFRVVAEALSPAYKLLTETNVPLQENLSYFGDGDEAHIVYNFPFPPLLLHALLTQNAQYLTRWCQSLPALPPGCVYLNFSASHDGIGLRPAEGILSEDDVNEVVECIRSFGGCVTERRRPDGSLSPYEVNVSLFDGLRGTLAGEDEWQVQRFLLSQCVMVSLAGVPALYYNSLLAAPNYDEGVRQTGRNRTINRRKWTHAEVQEHLANPLSSARVVIEGIQVMLRVRREQDAFHPEGTQECISVSPDVFSIRRRYKGQEILCLFNMTAKNVVLQDSQVPLLAGQSPRFIYRHGDVTHHENRTELPPYAAAWIQVT